MSETELEIERLEAKFPALSGSAFESAREQALGFGLSVVEVENGCLTEVHPDGSRRHLRPIAHPIFIQAGTVYNIP